MVHRIKSYTARGFRGLFFASAIFGTTALCQAQTPGGATAALPKKTFTKNSTFDLPIVMDDALRANLREVCLYVKRPGGTWSKQETVAPSTTRFAHKVAQDGEYWFSLVTVDKQGRMTPSDVNLEAPGLRVVIDTTPPVIQVQPWTSPEGESCLRCTVQDANGDVQMLKAICRLPAGETALEMHPSQPGTFKVRAEAKQATVRVSVSDMAGNAASRDVDLKEMFVATRPVEPIVPVMNTVPASTPAPMPAPTPAPMPAPSAPVVTSRVDLKPPPTQVETLPTLPSVPMIVETLRPAAPAPAITEVQPKAPAEAPTPSNPAKRQLINTTQASVDYHVDQVGPSGIGKVEAYLTADQGTAWTRLVEDVDRKSPLQLTLPGEGLFGVRLAITNGNGFGGTPPRPGDTAHVWIEVDTTTPFVQLRPSELVPSANALEIRWTASDKNLGSEPVSLYYRGRADAPWQSIARGLKNEGSHRWTFPRDAGSQFYFKVEVSDQAGNVGRAESAAPVVLDMTEPRVSVTGVSGMRVVLPNGN